MKNIIFLVVICFLPLCHSCNKPDGNHISIPVQSESKKILDIELKSAAINVDDVIDSLQFIPLETSDECLIGRINKIIYDDGKYYVLDREKTKTLFCFDSLGYFQRKIGSVGQGPAEFIEPTDFMFIASYLVILDQFTHKLLFYDKAGNYSHSVSFDAKVHGITSLDNDSLFLAQAGTNKNTDIADYELLVMNINGEVKNSILYNSYRMNYSTSGYYSQQMDGRTIYCRPMANRIYEVSDTGINVRYELNILNHPLPKNFEENCNGNYENFMKLYKNNYNYFSGQFIETKEHVFFTVINTKSQPIACFIDKKTNRQISGLLSAKNLGKDMAGYVFFAFNNYMTVNNNRIIGFVDSSYISDKEEDNPVLYSFLLKTN